MHSQFDISQDGTEFGIRFQERHVRPVDGGGAANKPHQGGGKSTPAPSGDRHFDEPKTKVAPTRAQRVAEATKDGRISGNREATMFEPAEGASKKTKKSAAANRKIAADHTDGLKDAVRKAIGRDHDREDMGKGKLMLDDKKQAQANYDDDPDKAGGADKTSHDQRVQKLTDKDEDNLDDLTDALKLVKDGPGAEGIRDKMKARAAEEGKVVGFLKNGKQYVAGLDVERRHLAKVKVEDPDAPGSKLRTKAAKLIEQFDAHGGKLNEGDTFGDDWDRDKDLNASGDGADAEKAFNRMAKHFNDEPHRLRDFAGSQGNSDDDLRGKSKEELKKALADDPDMAVRYEMAKQLTPIFKEYNELKDAGEGNKNRIAELDAEIKVTQGTIAEGEKALSGDVKKRYLADLKGDNKMLNRKGDAKAAREETSTEETTTKGNEGGGNASTEKAKNGNEQSQNSTKADEAETTEQATSNGGGNSSDAPARQEVLKAAIKQHYVPEGTTFNKQGNAVYEVQKGDSYWSIAERAGGANGFDQAVYSSTIAQNTKAGGDPNMIYAGTKVEIANRGYQELMKAIAEGKD